MDTIKYLMKLPAWIKVAIIAGVIAITVLSGFIITPVNKDIQGHDFIGLEFDFDF